MSLYYAFVFERHPQTSFMREHIFMLVLVATKKFHFGSEITQLVVIKLNGFSIRG